MEQKKPYSETTKDLRGATWNVSALSISENTTQEFETKLKTEEASILARLRQNLYITDEELESNDIKIMLENVLNGCSDSQLSNTIGTVEAAFKNIGLGLDSKNAVLLARKFHDQTGINDSSGITGFLSNLNYLNCTMNMNDVVSNYLHLYKSLISQVALHTPVFVQSFNIQYRSFGPQERSYQITLDGRHLAYCNPYTKGDTPVIGMIIEKSKKSRRYIQMLKTAVRDSYFSVHSAIRWANPEELKRPHGRSLNSRIRVNPASTAADVLMNTSIPATMVFEGLNAERSASHSMEVCVVLLTMNIDVLRTDHLNIQEAFVEESIRKGNHPIAESLQLLCGMDSRGQLVATSSLYAMGGVRTEMVSAAINVLHVVSQLGVFSVCKHL